MIFTSSSDIDVIQSNLSQDLDNLSNWFRQNELILNLNKGKSEVKLFGTGKRLNLYQDCQVKLSVNGSPINTTLCYKYLGIPWTRLLLLKRIFKKFTRRQQEEWTSYGASIPALILLVPNEFINRWLCQYLRIAAIIVLDGQGPANVWSASLRPEASESFPQNAVRRTVIFDF